MKITASVSVGPAGVSTIDPDPVADPAGRIRGRFIRLQLQDQPYNSIWTTARSADLVRLVLYHVDLSPTAQLPDDLSNLAMWRSGLQWTVDCEFEYTYPLVLGYTPGWYYCRVATAAPDSVIHFIPAVMHSFPAPGISGPTPPSPSTTPAITRPPRT